MVRICSLCERSMQEVSFGLWRCDCEEEDQKLVAALRMQIEASSKGWPFKLFDHLPVEIPAHRALRIALRAFAEELGEMRRELRSKR
jgi:hypothetical protein